jgi:AraC family transcriptional regulator, transcriptional activator of pobA
MSNTSSIRIYDSSFKDQNFSFFKFENIFQQADLDAITTNHRLNYYILFLVTDDIGRHSIDDKDYYFSKGTFFAIRKNKLHKFYFNDKAKGYLLFFKEEFLHNYLSEFELSKTLHAFNELLASPKTQLESNDFIEMLYLLEKIESEYTKISDSYSKNIIRSKIHILLTKIHRFKSRGYDKIQLSKYLKDYIKFQDLLEENYSKTKKVKDYARFMGFSSKKLNTIIKYVSNKPAKEFIDEFIIIKAKKKLLYSNSSIKEIAFELSFNDPTNFFKYFKKHTSFTPENFRKRYK